MSLLNKAKYQAEIDCLKAKNKDLCCQLRTVGGTGFAKNVGFSFTYSLADAVTPGILRVNPTIAAGDFQVSIDGGAFTNLATLPVVSPAGSTSVVITLSAAEMNGDNIVVRMADQTVTKEWHDAYITFITAV